MNPDTSSWKRKAVDVVVQTRRRILSHPDVVESFRRAKQSWQDFRVGAGSDKQIREHWSTIKKWFSTGGFQGGLAAMALHIKTRVQMHPKWAIAGVFALFAACLAWPDERPLTQVEATGGRRFSAAALSLLEQTTQAYDLDGRRMPAGRFDAATLAQLTKCDDSLVRDIASVVPQMKLLHELNLQGGSSMAGAVNDQVKQMPAIMAAEVIDALSSPDDEKDDIRSAARTIEALVGTEPQLAVNKAWSISCMTNGLSVALKAQLRKLASQNGSGTSADRSAVEVTLGTGGFLGTVNITNRSKTALHHCLVITTLEADRERLTSMAVQEDAAGAFLLPALGFSKETVAGSRLAARLRTCFNLQDKGVVVYVDEIPPGSTVTTMLANPEYFRIGKWAGVSFWSDEIAVERQPASNWEEVKSAVSMGGR